VATDPDPFMLRRAVARARQARQSGRRIRLVQCAAEALPFRDRTFDTVVAAMVL
jgi:ubiquinone/menaquinone biosynthesis C-methylase UbiE